MAFLPPSATWASAWEQAPFLCLTTRCSSRCLVFSSHQLKTIPPLQVESSVAMLNNYKPEEMLQRCVLGEAGLAVSFCTFDLFQGSRTSWSNPKAGRRWCLLLCFLFLIRTHLLCLAGFFFCLLSLRFSFSSASLLHAPLAPQSKSKDNILREVLKFFRFGVRPPLFYILFVPLSLFFSIK